MSSSSEHLRVIEGGKGHAAQVELRELYTRYGATVFNRCLYLLKDRAAAEDAMQDVFARALTGWSGFKAQASPATWLVKIATHHCLNQLRAERAGWRGLFERSERARSPVQNGPHVVETRDVVRKLLARFDVETQAAAIHYFVDGMTLEEVAALLERSVPTIRKRLTHFAEVGGQELKP